MRISFKEFMLSGAICSLNADEILIGWGIKTWAEEPLSYPAWYAPDFFLLTPKPFLHFSHTKRINNKELQFLKSVKLKIPFFLPEWSFFENLFKDFKQQKLEKMVPYVQKKAQFTISPLSYLKNCLIYKENHPLTAIYGFWDQTEGLLGVTPELLLSLKSGTLKTVACAGTCSTSKTDCMLKDLKLFKEHQLVIEGIQHSLQPFGKLSVGSTEMKSFSNLKHLITPIEVRGVNGDFKEIVAALHPTPALGTFPRKKDCDVLKNYAISVPRGRFGAPFGVLEAKDHALLHVAIRNIQWQNDTVTMTAGCGIVAESKLEIEKQEINEKFKAIHEILGIL